MSGASVDQAWLQQVDNFLAGMSWDRTWSEMSRLLAYAVQTNQNRQWRGKTGG